MNKTKHKGKDYVVYGRQRPNVAYFLQQVCSMFHIILFTASQKCYAEEIVSLLDVNGQYFDNILTREHCVQVKGNYVKDLRILGDNFFYLFFSVLFDLMFPHKQVKCLSV